MTVVSSEFGVVFDGGSSPAAAVVAAKPNFRELDDAFLQTQTRIWLGEVLQIRFNEDTDISDILADGKLLFDLSEVLSRMLPSLSVDATQSKSNDLKSSVSSMSTQYMRYHNVGSFLQMCKNLGLNGIDLFTPSDVVDKRNTRKVCMCIRSLSKKARSRDLTVPDFDSVTCTLTMPTNMVECIRKSLEMSQSSSTLSVGLEADKVSSVRSWNRISNSASTLSNECSSDIGDDAESRLTVCVSNEPSDFPKYDESGNISCSEVVGDHNSALRLKMRDLENEEDDQCEYLSPSNAESVGSPGSQYFSDQEISLLSPDCNGSHISGNVDYSEAKPHYQNGDVLHIPVDWEDRHPDFENHSVDYDHANNGESHYKQDADMACLNSCSSTSNDIHITSSENRTHLSEVESVKSSCSGNEQVNCTNLVSLGAISIRDILNNASTESEDSPGETRYPVQQLSCPVVSSPHSCDSSSLLADKSNGVDHTSINPISADHNGASGQLLIGDDALLSADTESSMAGYDKDAFDANTKSSDHIEEHSNHGVMNVALSTFPDTPQATSFYMESENDSSKFFENSREIWEITEDHKPLDASENVKPISIDDNVVVNSLTTTVDDFQLGDESHGSVEDTGRKLLEIEEHTEKGAEHKKQEDATNDMPQVPQNKPQRKLLKTIVKGTAVLGIAVFVLLLRKNRQQNPSQTRQQPIEKRNASTPSSNKVQKGSINSRSVYPAENLSFED